MGGMNTISCDPFRCDARHDGVDAIRRPPWLPALAGHRLVRHKRTLCPASGRLGGVPAASPVSCRPLL